MAQRSTGWSKKVRPLRFKAHVLKILTN